MELTRERIARSAGNSEMNRVDFMNQLESLLQNVSPTEREEALQYYNDYFDDAGPENEKEVIDALGNPARVAENIKKELQEGGDTRARASDRALVEYGKSAGRQAAVLEPEKKKTQLPTWAAVLLTLLLVIASPGILGAGLGAMGILVGIIVGWFSLIFGFAAAAVGLLIAMVVCVILGMMCIPADGLVGMGVIGCGLVCGGIGILLLMLAVAMGGIVTPGICKGIARLFRKKTAEGREN